MNQPSPDLVTELDAFLRTQRDPFDVNRRHRITQPGDPNRRQRLPGMWMRWAQMRHIELDGGVESGAFEPVTRLEIR